MNDAKATASSVKRDGSLVRVVIALVCLYAADVQFLLSLKLIFYDKEFATLGLSFVLLIVFLIPFLILGQKVPPSLPFMLLGFIGSALIALVGALLIGVIQSEGVYAVLVGFGAAVFGAIIFAVSRLIHMLCFRSCENPDGGSVGF